MKSVWWDNFVQGGPSFHNMGYYGDFDLKKALFENCLDGSFQRSDIRFKLRTAERFQDEYLDADVPEWCGPQVFFRKSTCGGVIPELPRWGRVWDVDCDGGEYVMFSPPCELDIYDYEKSEFEYRSGGNINRFTKTVFYSDRIPETAFVAPPRKGRGLYIPGEMMDLLVSEKLTGLTFEKVWEY